MAGIVSYKIKLDLEDQEALKRLADIDTKITNLKDGQVLIDFKYNENMKDFNKKVQQISKINPELGIQFQYDINKRGLLAAQEKLAKLQEVDVKINEKGIKGYVNELISDIRKQFNSGVSEKDLAAPVQKLLNITKSIDPSLLAYVETEIGDIYDKFSGLSKLKPLKIFDLNKRDDIEKDIKYFQGAVDQLKKDGAIDLVDASDNKDLVELTERVSFLEDQVLSLKSGMASINGDGFMDAAAAVDTLSKSLSNVLDQISNVSKEKKNFEDAIVHVGDISYIGSKNGARSDNLGRLPELLRSGMGSGSGLFFSYPEQSDVAAEGVGSMTSGFDNRKTYLIDLGKIKDMLHQLSFESQEAEDSALRALRSINAFALKEAVGVEKYEKVFGDNPFGKGEMDHYADITSLFEAAKKAIPNMSLTIDEFNQLLSDTIDKLKSMGDFDDKGIFKNQSKYGNDLLASDMLLERLGYTGFSPIRNGDNDGSGVGGWLIRPEKYLSNNEKSSEYLKIFDQTQSDEALDLIENIESFYDKLNRNIDESNQSAEGLRGRLQNAIEIARKIVTIVDGKEGIQQEDVSVDKTIGSVEQSAKEVVNEYVDTIKDGSSEAEEAGEQLANATINGITEAINSLSDKLSSVINVKEEVKKSSTTDNGLDKEAEALKRSKQLYKEKLEVQKEELKLQHEINVAKAKGEDTSALEARINPRLAELKEERAKIQKATNSTKNGIYLSSSELAKQNKEELDKIKARNKAEIEGIKEVTKLKKQQHENDAKEKADVNALIEAKKQAAEYAKQEAQYQKQLAAERAKGEQQRLDHNAGVAKEQLKKEADAYSDIIKNIKQINDLKEKNIKLDTSSNEGAEKYKQNEEKIVQLEQNINSAKTGLSAEKLAEVNSEYTKMEQHLENIQRLQIAKQKDTDIKEAANMSSQTDTLVRSLDKLKKTNKFTDDFVDKIDIATKSLGNLKESLDKFDPEVNDISDLRQEFEKLSDTVKDISGEKALGNVKKAAEGTIAKLDLQIAEFESKNTAMGKNFRDQFEGLRLDLKAAENLDDVNRIVAAFGKLKAEVIDAGKAGKSFFTAIKEKAFYKAAQVIGTYFSFQDIIRYARSAITTIQELDTALVDLRKTTTMSASELNNFYFSANDVAKQMGVTTKEIISQAAAWSRLGYSSKEEAETMATLSSQFASISPGMDVESATDGLVSAMKAFHVETSDVERDIMDNINRIGNTMATSNEEIVNMLERSSAAMDAANNTIEQTIALESAAVQITRNAETTGTAFRTISMRIRGKQSMPPYKETYMLCA